MLESLSLIEPPVIECTTTTAALAQSVETPGYNEEYDPFDYFGARMVSDDLRSAAFPGLPG
jgi:hypothetical protein